MRLAERMSRVVESGTQKMKRLSEQLKAQGREVISFSVGEPDFDTPRHIRDAAIESINAGFTHYVNAPGIPELRKAVAERAKKENGIPCDEKNVLVTPTKQAIFESIFATVGPGDEVIIPDPCWVSYDPMINLAGGVPVPVVTPEEADFRLLPEDVAEAITPKTKVIMLNSPSNPCGAVSTKEDLRGIADLAKDHDLVVLSDEVYEKIVYDAPHYSIAAFDGMFDRTITVSGFSKTYAMTGWRLGWLIAPKPIFDAVNLIQQHSITHPTSFVQKAGAAALISDQACVKEMVEEFRLRRSLVMEAMKGISQLSCNTPKGAFYVFPRYDVAKKMGSEEMAMYLLEHAAVAVTGGGSFGKAGEGHLRISYATSRPKLQKGMAAIKDALDKLGG